MSRVRIPSSAPVFNELNLNLVGWPRGEAQDCKSCYTGSNPVPTSHIFLNLFSAHKPHQVKVLYVQQTSGDPLERKYRGESPVRTLFALFAPEKKNIGISSIFYIMKQSPAWLFPLVTANMIDILVYKKPLWQLFANAIFIGLLTFQNWPNHVLFVK